MTDPYGVLGVSPEASDDEISKVYRALAKKYHPDLNPGDTSAEAKMRSINEAYESIKTMRASGNRTNTDPRYRANTANSANQGYNPYNQYYYYNPYTQGQKGFDPFEDLYGNAQRFYQNRGTQRSFTIRPFRIVRIILIIYILRWVLLILANLFYSGGYIPPPV